MKRFAMLCSAAAMILAVAGLSVAQDTDTGRAGTSGAATPSQPAHRSATGTSGENQEPEASILLTIQPNLAQSKEIHDLVGTLRKEGNVATTVRVDAKQTERIIAVILGQPNTPSKQIDRLVTMLKDGGVSNVTVTLSRVGSGPPAQRKKNFATLNLGVRVRLITPPTWTADMARRVRRVFEALRFEAEVVTVVDPNLKEQQKIIADIWHDRHASPKKLTRIMKLLENAGVSDVRLNEPMVRVRLLMTPAATNSRDRSRDLYMLRTALPPHEAKVSFEINPNQREEIVAKVSAAHEAPAELINRVIEELKNHGVSQITLTRFDEQSEETSSSLVHGGIAPGEFAGAEELLLYLSKAGDMLSGFSKTKGQWSRQRIAPPIRGRVLPVLLPKLGGLRHGNKVYAFSGPQARWGVLEIPAGLDDSQITWQNNVVIVQLQDKVMVFSAATGRWASSTAAPISGPGPRDSNNTGGRGGMMSGNIGFSDNGSTNPIGGGRISPSTKAAAGGTAKWIELARRIQQLSDRSHEADDLKQRLRISVAREFAERQRRQQEELARLKARLERIERLIARRAKNRDRIIARRVEELLDPTLQWEPPDGATTDVPTRTVPEGASSLVAPVDASETTMREECQHNLRRLAMAIHNYHDEYGRFPPAVITHHRGKKLQHPYSWRVALLPYLDQEELYARYDFEQPWNAEANLRVLAEMPDVFRLPGDAKKSTNTAYFALVGPGTAFEGDEGIRIGHIYDGSANTLLLVEARRKTPVPWTKPEDIRYDPKAALPQLGGFHADHFHAAFADGSVRSLPRGLDETTLRRLIERNDGQSVTLP